MSTSPVNTGINAYVNRNVRKALYSKFFTVRPLLYFIAGDSNYNLDKLITPFKDPTKNFGAAVSLGGGMKGLAERMNTLGSVQHEFRYQKANPTAGSNVAPGGATPTASVSSEDLVGTAETRWNTKMWPLEVRESSIENARGKFAIGSIIDESMSFTWNKAFEDRASDFWSGTLTAAQQDKTEWEDGMIGVSHWVDDGVVTSAYATVGRIDRTVQTYLKANAFAASTLVSGNVIPTTKPTLGMIRTLRNSATYGGIAHKASNAGNLAITTPDLWLALAEEADGAHTIYESGSKIPGLGMDIGFQQPVILKDTTYITYDPGCPSGELYLLTTGSWCYEIAEGLNYHVGPWVKKHETEQGGQRKRWTHITVKDRFTCLAPWLNTKVTGLTT